MYFTNILLKYTYKVVDIDLDLGYIEGGGKKWHRREFTITVFST